MPESAFHNGVTNGIVSEAMFIWFPYLYFYGKARRIAMGPTFALLGLPLVLVVAFLAASCAFLLGSLVESAPGDARERMGGGRGRQARRTALGVALALARA